ncbi:MAG TPA: toll/interleukin-1 receptor domain-containing protein [Longimicrobium sp.]|nr:toll/interleukin-1 receptor domain-containing protein [Longimicrobium sp.]
MAHSVFISYARDASRAHAEAIHQALGGAEDDICFLDTEDIGIGEPFPERLVDELFGAQVVVILAEPTYFTRRYCLQEFHIATGPFSRLLEGSRPTEKQKEEAIRGIVVALPERGIDPMMERFPAKVAGRNWPRADQAEEVAALVRAELALDLPTLRERYAALGADEEARALFLAKSALPTPLRIGSIPMAPTLGIPISIGDAFVGRADDMWRLHDVLTSRRGDLRTAAGITGSIEAGGGFGKTRLAVEYLYRFGTRTFRGGLFWIDAEQDPENRLYEILVALNPFADPIEIVRKRPGGVAAAVARAIRSLPQDSSPPLFIIDNVPEPAPGDVPKPLETWCPVPGEVSVLTTSRTQVALGGGRVEAVRIDVLDPDAAVDLVSAGVVGLSREQWGEIAQWVGYLPLALELLNRAMECRAIEPRDVLSTKRKRGTTTQSLEQAEKALSGVLPEGSVRGVSQAFAISYGRLTPEQQTAARLLAWLAPTPIPLVILEAFEEGTFPPPLRAVLRTRSFVSEVAGGNHEYFGTVHRVLGDYLRSCAETPHAEAERVASAILRSITGLRGTGDEGLRNVRLCIPSILTAANHFFDEVESHGSALGVTFADWAVVELGEWWGMALPAYLLVESLVERSETLLGPEHPITLKFKSNLASTLSDRGDWARAQELHEVVLSMRKRILGEEHRDTLATMSNLAIIYRERGNAIIAQELLERALAVSSKALGEDDEYTLTFIQNLAITLKNTGDITRAYELNKRLFASRMRVSGPEHPDTLASMHNLAISQVEMGDLAGGHALAERTAEKYGETMGDEHRETLTALDTVATLRAKKGDLVGARTLYERVLDVRQRMLGPQHPATLRTMKNLASALHDEGQLQAALELLMEVWTAWTGMLGLHHPETSLVSWEVCRLLPKAGDYDKASSVFVHSLDWLLDEDENGLPPIQAEIAKQLKTLHDD